MNLKNQEKFKKKDVFFGNFLYYFPHIGYNYHVENMPFRLFENSTVSNPLFSQK